jgi:hypothetical protein
MVISMRRSASTQALSPPIHQSKGKFDNVIITNERELAGRFENTNVEAYADPKSREPARADFVFFQRKRWKDYAASIET